MIELLLFNSVLNRKVTANFVEAQELNMLSGLISIGGDSLEDTERVYD
jgi:hypothetical protein